MRIRRIILACCLMPPFISTAMAAAQIRHRLIDTIDAAADGTFTRTLRFERRALNDEAAKTIGQFALSFSPSRERMEIVEAYTQKPDGERIVVAPEGIHEQLPTGAANLDRFSDTRQKVIVFPRVAARDTEVLVIRHTQFATQLPNIFSLARSFARTQGWDEVRISVRAPASMALQVDQLGFTENRTADNGFTRHEWRLTRQPELNEDEGVLAATDRPVPRLVVTNASDWDQVGRAYGDLARPKEVVTPSVQAKADAVTAGITDPRAQAEKLYEWVSRNIRYVAVYLGNGGVEPHDADSVLAAGYGDCKDHVVLLGAMLRAKGIDSVPALINLGNAYRVSVPAPFVPFNHVITYLPAFDTYLDSTMAVAPFGVLAVSEYGKPVVHAGGPGRALRRTPTLPPGLASVEITTEASLRDDGRMIGKTETRATGPFSLDLRNAGLSMRRGGTTASASRQLRAFGDDGTGALTVPAFDLNRTDYAVSASFDIDGEIHLAGDVSLGLPVGLPLLPRPGDGPIGPGALRGLAATEPTPCYAARQVETLKLTLPPAKRVARLPADRTIEGASFRYASRWSQDGDTITVRRELVSTIQGPLCEGEARAQAAQASREIRRDRAARVLLAEE